jgi:hypothetical protein
LPNEGGAFPIIENDKHLGFTESQEFSEIKNWLKTIPDLKLIVFDPVASFVWGADTNDASAMTFLMNTLQGIATETGACCIVTHHTNKPARNSQGKFQEHETIEDIFHSMRGSTAIGNGARLVYVIAEASKSVQDKVFKALERKRERHTVYIGGVAKSNGITNKEEQIFLRDEEKGLLINVTTKVKDKTLSKKDLKEVLLKTISDYEEKNPFTLTGPWGLFHRRYELPSVLQDRPRKELEDLANQLLQEERIGKYAKKRSAKASYLGITGGLLSRGKETDNLYDPSLKAAFIQAIYEAEQEGQPFNKGGVSSPWNKREKLPPEFSDLSEKQLRKMTEDILTEKSVVKAMHGFEKNAQWLCAPNGSLAMNPEDYEFKKGSIRQNVGSILGEKR